ncbi:unnamed protein product [Penicillium nalgiovense]|uniref:Uncharacterized protein n=1 Tax=Penicillium nalgiovense TaxID=60175 RepID=A0A9W4MXF4_PENNA|nr:unnamed protein product [Penicillium nalgiovense]CAG8197759.1 unnamed protein product [Penicillium nalgiovense]CAG8209989.1 unnamed protein product [Penicillium nalgiovense]CAG8213092.1 unnamed protein product [Penicillium nalgiovense]CAG8213493.1 unnamed protein product [Penicillium nalgiovense]
MSPWNRCLVGWIPSTHFSIKPRGISRKSHMSWMSLKLQVSQQAACLCLSMSFSNLSRKQLLPGTRRILCAMRRLSFQH